jgi:uncharacterized DUF497 family protein
MAGFLYEFEWDPVKAKANLNKHGLDFETATQVFRDPLAVTIADEKHSGTEVRFELLADGLGRLRLISARHPTRAECLVYEEKQ